VSSLTDSVVVLSLAVDVSGTYCLDVGEALVTMSVSGNNMTEY